MTASYPRMLTQFNGQFRRMFGELLAGHAPLAFNCSAGKDRTGLAAALLLTALGVPRATVIEDYELTNKTLNPAALLAAGNKATPSPFGKLPPEVVAPFMRADRAYIQAALAVVDGHKGGAPAYLKDELGWARRRSPDCANSISIDPCQGSPARDAGEPSSGCRAQRRVPNHGRALPFALQLENGRSDIGRRQAKIGSVQFGQNSIELCDDRPDLCGSSDDVGCMAGS
jgi:hypothetical protein